MKEYILSRQIIKSGTSIGALIRESESSANEADFINKLTVALKEANETEFWLLLMNTTDYIAKEKFDKLQSNRKELIAMLVS